MQFPVTLLRRTLAGRIRALTGKRSDLAVAASCTWLLVLTLLAPASYAQPTDAPVIQRTDVKYLGSFDVPQGFEYSGMAPAFNPTNNSLFLAAGQYTAELRIPSLGGTATFVQPLADAFNGRIGAIGGSDHKLGGHLVYNGRLYLTAFVFYDASSEARASHFSRSSTSLSSGSLSGPFSIGNFNPGFYSGYMTTVPPEWRAALGGPAVTGNCCLSIISRTSYGPALFAFDPETMSSATPLLYYDQAHQTLGQYGSSAANPVLNGATRITGVVIPPGTGTALFIGSTGLGTPCYGTGAQCNDPEFPHQGDHAYPYRAYAWAYRLSDLAAVRAGTKSPWQVTPYATWELSELGNVKADFGVGGATYDPSTRRLYVAKRCGRDPNGACLPQIHVYELGVGSATAPSPADTVAPSVSLTAPTGGTVSGTLSLSATASDNVGVAGVWFTVNGTTVGTEDTTAPYQTSWNTATVANGTHTIRALARDAAGNTATSAAITVTVNNSTSDSTAPTVSLTSPTAGATVSGTVAVSASASDNVGVASVQFTLNGTNLGSADTTAPYTINWNTAGAANGTHTLRAIARDAAGNVTTSAARTVTVNNPTSSQTDVTRPTVSLTAPAAGATVSGTITVAANASDNVGVTSVQFTLNGNNLGAADTSAPYAITWDTTAVTNGSYVLRAVARDAAGNTRTSSSRTITVRNAARDTTAPTVSLTAPAAGATVRGTVTVTATASDDVGVASVQFTLNGVNLGAADTTEPYAINWSTANAVNGTHTLRAIARDAAGNVTTSTARTVVVNNTVTVPPVAAPSAATPSACATADPFAAMGGGTCYNGGWLPPGMAPPAPATGQSAAAPAPSVPLVPLAPASCVTPDPFSAMGGGTCYNGGWLPPGMRPPAAAVAPPAVTVPTVVAPPASSTGCTTPQPGAGWSCQNGGWLPPNHPGASR